MSTIYDCFRFLCCKKTRLQTDSYDNISSNGEWYNEWEKEFDNSSALRQKYAQFYSSIPKIDKRTETQPGQCVS